MVVAIFARLVILLLSTPSYVLVSRNGNVSRSSCATMLKPAKAAVGTFF